MMGFPPVNTFSRAEISQKSSAKVIRSLEVVGHVPPVSLAAPGYAVTYSILIADLPNRVALSRRGLIRFVGI